MRANPSSRSKASRQGFQPGRNSSTAQDVSSAPTLGPQASANDAVGPDAALTQAERSLLDTLCERAHALSWPVGSPHAVGRDDVAAYFRTLMSGAAQLHRIHRDCPASPKLASCIHALGELLTRLNAALKRDVEQGGIDGAAFGIDQLKAVFGALSALADPGHPALFSRQQRRALQARMQELTASLLPRLLDKPSSLDARHLSLLNWICRGVKKGLLKPDETIAAIFDKGVTGIDNWLAAEDEEPDAFEIGECAAIIKTVVEHDLLRIDAAGADREDKDRRIAQCVLELLSARTLAVLERPPVNGVAVINLCNLVKELLEGGAFSPDDAAMGRLLDLVLIIPNEAMSGGDGRVLSNAANFLRALMPRKAEAGPAANAAPLPAALIPACGRVLAALNARAFGESAKSVQSLANLASFLQDLHGHGLPRDHDDGMNKSLAGAVARLIDIVVATGTGVFTERATVDGLLAALAYFQAHGLCQKTARLLQFRDALVAKRSGLSSEQVPTPARLNPIDAALPSLSAAPKLARSQASAEGAGNAAQQRRIPGDGNIVAPPKPAAEEPVSASTTYVKPIVGRGKFVKAGRARPDARSVAAHEAVQAKGAIVDADDDEAQESEQRAEAGNFSSASRNGTGNDHRASRNGRKDRGKALAVDPTAVVESIRKGDTNRLRRLLDKAASVPPLPDSFLLEMTHRGFLSHQRDLVTLRLYLDSVDEAGMERLRRHFAEHAPASPKLNELLRGYRCVKLYSVDRYQALLDDLLQASRNQDLVRGLAILKETDDACIVKLAAEPGFYRTVAATALLGSGYDAQLKLFFDRLEMDPHAASTRDGFFRTLVMMGDDRKAMSLLALDRARMLHAPVAARRLAEQCDTAPLFSLPMYVAAHDRRDLLEAMYALAPQAFAMRHAFGFNVLTAALMMERLPILQWLLDRLPPAVVDALAAEPALPADEAAWKKPQAESKSLRIDMMNSFDMGYMPGFNLIAVACAMGSASGMQLLLAHDGGHIARQRSAPEWQAIFAWPASHTRRLLESFIVAQLCAACAAGDEARVAHWIASAPHLVAHCDGEGGQIALDAAIAANHPGVVALLLQHQPAAQLAWLDGRNAGAGPASRYPRMDARIAELLEAARHR